MSHFLFYWICSARRIFCCPPFVCGQLYERNISEQKNGICHNIDFKQAQVLDLKVSVLAQSRSVVKGWSLPLGIKPILEYRETRLHKERLRCVNETSYRTSVIDFPALLKEVEGCDHVANLCLSSYLKVV